MSKAKTSRRSKKNGRPLVELDELQIRDIELLAAYLPIEKIADYLDICEDTFHEIKKRDKRVFRAYKRGVSKAQAFAGNNMMKFMQYNGENPSQLQMKYQATSFYLKTKCGWLDRQQTEKKKPTLKVLDSKDPIDIIDLAIDGWKNGNLSPQEAQQVGSLAMAKCNIEERTLANMHDNNDAHRTEEERKAELDLIRKGIFLKEEQARRQK